MKLAMPPLEKLGDKRIPTIAGLVILVIALILGTVFFQQGLGVFAPRATAETTPNQVRITNLTNDGFTVSFLTEAEISGLVKYGTEESALKQTATDDRDSLTGSIGEYKLHHITVRGLQPNTTYYYVLGTGNGALFDNNGSPFKIITARKTGSPPAARTIYGSVTTESGAPAEGAVVYLAIDGAGEMSSLVKNSGGWAVPLSNARTADGASYAQITDETNLQLFVQGPLVSQTAKGSMTAGQYETAVPTISYGQTAIVETAAIEPTNEPVMATEETNDTQNEIASTSEVTTSAVASDAADLSATSSAMIKDEKLVLDLTEDNDASAPATVTTTQPVITGKALPNVTVSIEIHSDTAITQQVVANADGSFALDLEDLKKQLEPGEHTVTYSYIDPSTGETVPKTITFYVEPQTSTATLAQASTPTPTPTPTATPYGSSNPYPIDGTASSSLSSTASGTATGSGRTSQIATSGGLPKSGSVGTTMALIFGGLFFITSGLWSFWVSKQYSSEAE